MALSCELWLRHWVRDIEIQNLQEVKLVIDVKINRPIASRHIGFTDRFW